MRTLIMGIALAGLVLIAAPAHAADDLASLQERLQVTEDTIKQLEDRWGKLGQELADPNVMVTPQRFEKIRVDQVRQLADLAFKLAREHPDVVTALQKSYPKEFGLLNDYGIKLADLADPLAAFVVQGPLEMLLTSQLPQVKKDYAEHLKKEHDQARQFLEDRKREINDQIAALSGGQQPGTAAGTDTGSQPGTGDTGSQAGTGSAGGTDTGSQPQGGTGTQAGTGQPGTELPGTDPGGTDLTLPGQNGGTSATEQAVTAGSDGPPAPKPAAGSQPFDATALANQAWPGTWEMECRDGASGKVDKKQGVAEFRFEGHKAIITIKGNGEPMSMPVDLDAQGAFAMLQSEQGSEVGASGQFQNFDYGDGSYAPQGAGSFKFAIDFSFMADVVGGVLSFGAASEAELTPAQHEANTTRCTGKWELPLPG